MFASLIFIVSIENSMIFQPEIVILACMAENAGNVESPAKIFQLESVNLGYLAEILLPELFHSHPI